MLVMKAGRGRTPSAQPQRHYELRRAQSALFVGGHRGRLYGAGICDNAACPMVGDSSITCASGPYFAGLPFSRQRNRAPSLATEMVISVPDWLLRASPP